MHTFWKIFKFIYLIIKLHFIFLWWRDLWVSRLKSIHSASKFSTEFRVSNLNYLAGKARRSHPKLGLIHWRFVSLKSRQQRGALFKVGGRFTAEFSTHLVLVYLFNGRVRDEATCRLKGAIFRPWHTCLSFTGNRIFLYFLLNT